MVNVMSHPLDQWHDEVVADMTENPDSVPCRTCGGDGRVTNRMDGDWEKNYKCPACWPTENPDSLILQTTAKSSQHLRAIASRGYTTDEDNQWLFDLADQLDETPESPDSLTATELIADLNERINRAVEELAYTYNPVVRHPTIEGKIRGLQLVADWLRSYG